MTWSVTVIAETQSYELVLHKPITLDSIQDVFELPIRDQEIFVSDIRGPRRVPSHWHARENCQVHFVSPRFAHVGTARVAELRSSLHRVVPTTIQGEDSRFVVWMWDGLIFSIQRVPPNAVPLSGIRM